MACPEFEEVVRQGPHGHAARCEDCRTLLEALDDVDAALEASFAGISAPPALAAAVRMRIETERGVRLPLLPDLLDLIGWAAIVTLVAVLLPRYLPILNAALGI